MKAIQIKQQWKQNDKNVEYQTLQKWCLLNGLNTININEEKNIIIFRLVDELPALRTKMGVSRDEQSIQNCHGQ